MFILPIAHEQGTVRRWPVVTMGILAINVAMLVVSMLRVPADVANVETKLIAASHYARDKPWVRSAASPGCLAPTELEMEPPLTRVGMKPVRAPEVGSPEEKHDQAEMKRLCAAADKSRSESFLYRYGFVPQSFTWYSLFTHQFVHGGVLHLVFNVWFLWLCGCNLEDRWGRLVFPLFYLGGGVAAAFAHKALTESPGMPMIGASGAVAAAMGAFLAILARTKIRFFYVYAISFRVRTGTFEASAYWMLPLWLASEVFSAVVMKHAHDGVAHWAHIGGFVVGLLFGLAMKFSGADKRLDAKQEESLTVLREDPAMGEAARLVDEGKYPEAIAKLESLAAHRPDDVDVQVELLRASTLARDLPRRQRAYARLLVLYVNQGFADAAADVYKEVRLNQMEEAIPRATAFVVAEGFARHKKSDAALLAYRRVRAEGLTDELAVRAGVGEANVLKSLGRKADARGLLEECRASPFCTVELDAIIETQVTAMGPASIAV